MSNRLKILGVLLGFTLGVVFVHWPRQSYPYSHSFGGVASTICPEPTRVHQTGLPFMDGINFTGSCSPAVAIQIVGGTYKVIIDFVTGAVTGASFTIGISKIAKKMTNKAKKDSK